MIKDILIGGNLFASEIETPRNDSSIGAYLKGDGEGNFSVIASDISGLYLKGDVKDISTILIDDRKYIIASTNNDYPQFIQITNSVN